MEDIYQRFYSKVLSYLLSRVRPPEEAEDVCSEVFEKILRGLEVYDEKKGAISAWIYRIAHNTALNHIKARRPAEALDATIRQTLQRYPSRRPDAPTRESEAKAMAPADSLHRQIGRLEDESVVAEVDAVLRGLEYLLGIREGNAPEELERFYRDELGVSFTVEQREAARRVVQPGEASVFFPDFDNVPLQALFSMPENWGLSIEELEALRDEE